MKSKDDCYSRCYLYFLFQINWEKVSNRIYHDFITIYTKHFEFNSHLLIKSKHGYSLFSDWLLSDVRFSERVSTYNTQSHFLYHGKTWSRKIRHFQMRKFVADWTPFVNLYLLTSDWLVKGYPNFKKKNPICRCQKIFSFSNGYFLPFQLFPS